jgi:hypothetical protein
VQRLLGVAAVVALAVCLHVSVAAAGVPSGTFAGCPRATLPLPGGVSVYAAAARNVVLRHVRAHHPHLRIAGARADLILLVRDWLPSGWIRSECGATVWRRSLAVGVYFPAMDPQHNPVGHCNDCAHVTYTVSRTRRGWLVWGSY